MKDQETFVKEVFQLYFEKLHRYAFTMLKDNDSAKDAVQAVFLKLLEKKIVLDEERSITSYLYTAVYNYCLNAKRHEKVKEQYITANSGFKAQQEDPLVSKETYERIMAHINELSPQCQLIFRKSRFEGKKYVEIATELGLSVKTVEAQMGKALQLLRTRLFRLMLMVLLAAGFPGFHPGLPGYRPYGADLLVDHVITTSLIQYNVYA
ncbi:RNA polymerase sigma-70 factor [Chitinophaga vietnamensis]|uniref:RNA polymerase sigma-70 factor n=1 Tax=Chitinophaga vietnamensis TaxID=2593957 RepID=UPI0013755778|nr:RNA polymerase sigma-70 factor [Chitinophaga vietnamensis]